MTNLLDMSRVQSGALELRRGPWPWSTWWPRPCGTRSHRPAPGALTIDLADDLPLVDVDHLLIGQVLTNLLDNAAALRAGGLPRLACRAGSAPTAGWRWR